MRCPIWVLCLPLALAACSASETCSSTVSCGNGGNYQACSDGHRCRFVASDGSSFACASCGDCQAATMKAVSWCAVPGGGSGGSGGSGGNGAQPEVCADYLGCAAALDPAGLPALIASYGPDGSCWQSTAMLAATCATACANALATARMSPSAPAACAGGGTAAPSCSDGVHNGDESDVDCGGSCGTCADGRACRSNDDCASGTCSSIGRCGDGGVGATSLVYQTSTAPVPLGMQAPYFGIAAAGTSFRLVWVGDGQARVSGWVTTTGTFSAYDPGCGGLCGAPTMAMAPYSVPGGARIDFESATSSALAGFDFVVTAEPVYFHLYIDGVAVPARVIFPDASGNPASPTAIPFGLTD